ncbi:MAG: DUF1320 domain-containing protein [Candidatus Pacebacteria bacterium]|nr:DUF1320 domain-containing protein [Candidatus Paceibacterota bacterium]
MAYATPLDLLKRIDADDLARLCDRATPRTIDGDSLSGWLHSGAVAAKTSAAALTAAAAVIDAAINDADAEINGWLAARYPTPLSNPPLLIKRFAVEIAVYQLHRGNVTEAVENRYKHTVESLKEISRGRMSLASDYPVVSSGGAMGAVQHSQARLTRVQSSPRVFGGGAGS